MIDVQQLDCIVIGHNEVPFGQYESLVSRYGTDSESYRDLQLSFVDVGGEKLTYVDLMNRLDGARKGFRTSSFRSGGIPALAASYLTNYLRRRGKRAGFINLFQDEKDLLAELLRQKPLCVAITTTLYVWNFPATEIVEYVRRCNEEVKIVVGGPLVANHARNYDPATVEFALLDIGADIFVVESQGEETLNLIVEQLKGDGDLSGVPNLYYMEEGKIRKTPAKPEANGMDENIIDWRSLADHDLGSTIQTRTARSCAFKCAFCNYPARAGKLTLANVESVRQELDWMRELGTTDVVFIDDTFNVPLPRFKDICRMMIDEAYGYRWYSYFRCSNSDEETIELMARSGCSGVFLGIESGSPAILKGMNKAATIEKYLEGVRMLRDHGILTFGSFITGFPGETDETVAQTVDFINAAPLDYFRTQLWYCEKGTPIDKMRDRYEIEGDGFSWVHATMDSMEAMDHIERLFLTTSKAVWLPQWSFDFWIIPYLSGLGMSRQQFRSFASDARELLTLEVATLAKGEKARRQQQLIRGMEAEAAGWPDPP